MSSSIKEFNDLVNNIPDVNTLGFLIEEFNKKGVKVSYEKAEGFSPSNPVYSRFTFGTLSRSRLFDFTGIVMVPDGSNSLKAISVPPPPPITVFKSKFLHQNFRNEDTTITKVNDGTTITLYYFNNKWVISTHRGFEVNSYKWVAKKTYQDIVDDVLNNYPKFSYDNLDKSKSYTIGFNHSDFHPFREGKEVLEKPNVSAWFIQSSDLNKFNASDKSYVSYDEDIGIPFQEKSVFHSLKALFQSANNAYKDYAKNGNIDYGYLIRVESKQYLVESTLLSNIRHIFYSNKFNYLDDVIDKNKYIIVNSFLDARRYGVFRVLFPQYDGEFKSLEKKMDDLMDSIMKIINIYENKEKFEPVNIVDVVAKELYEQFSKTINIKDQTKDALIDLVYAFIYDTKFTGLVYKLNYI